MKDTQGVPDFFHPSEIMGQSVQQVKQILSEDTPVEYIQGVYTPQTYLQILQSANFFNTFASFNPGIPEPALRNKLGQLIEMVKSYITPQNNQPQIDMTQLANITSGNEEENFDISQTQTSSQVVIDTFPPQYLNPQTGQTTSVPGYVQKLSQPIPLVQPKTETKYFTESGIKFKLENGELYKKEWTDTPIEPYMDKVTDPKTGEEKEVEIIPDFRLVNKETGKPVKQSKYVLQQAIWKKLES